MGLVAQAIEERGIPTVTLAMEHGVEASRVAYVPFPYNFPMGESGNRESHRAVALAALGLFGDLNRPGEIKLPFEW